MKKLLTLLLLSPILVLGHLQRHNDQGLSPTHSYKSFAADENISNLNGNLVILSEPARIDRTGMGIRLTRSFNSHWRNPIHTHQYDMDFDNAHERTKEGSPKIGLKNTNMGSSHSVTYTSPLLQKTQYQVSGFNTMPNGFYFSASITHSAARTVLREYHLSQRDPNGNQPPLTGMAGWMDVGLGATGIGLQIASIYMHAESGAETDLRYAVERGIGMSLAVHGLIRSVDPTFFSQGMSNYMAGVSTVFTVYQSVRYLEESNAWDPGVEAQRFAAFANIVGAVLTLVPVPYLGVALLVINVGAMVWSIVESETMEIDFGEIAVRPWSLGINGYVGMVGNKYQENLSSAAAKFWGYESTARDFTTTGTDTIYGWKGQNPRSMHPMPEMFLIRADGGADRFILNIADSVEQSGVRWYAYTALSRGVRTEILFRDTLPFEGPGSPEQTRRHIENTTLPKFNENDPNDYYLVKEPDGTFARFGAGNLKGVDLDRTGWGDPFEVYWAMPDRFWNFAGDTVQVTYDSQKQVTQVRHSEDPRHVRINRSQSNIEQVETWEGERKLFTVEQEFAEHTYNDGRLGKRTSIVNGAIQSVHRQAKARMLVRESVPGGSQDTLTTSYQYAGGNLSRRNLPDGSHVEYDFVPAGKHALEGFCQVRRHHGITDGAIKESRYTYLGWQDTRSEADRKQVERLTKLKKAVEQYADTAWRAGFTINTIERRLTSLAGPRYTIADIKGWNGALPSELQDSLNTELAKLPFMETLVETSLRTPGSPSGVHYESKTDHYRYMAAQDGRNIRKNQDYLPQTSMLDTNVQRDMEYRTTRMQLSMQILGSDGNGKRTDYIYKADRLVGTSQYLGAGTNSVPVITQYIYDSRGNKTMERINGTDMLMQYHALMNMNLDNQDTAALAQQLSDHLQQPLPANYPVLEKATLYTYDEDRRHSFYNDSVLVKKNAQGEDSVQTTIRMPNPEFNPWGRYLSGVPSGTFELNLHPDSTAPKSWLSGTFTVRDSAYLRPLREYTYRFGKFLPRRDWTYDAQNPYFATRERIYAQHTNGSQFTTRITEHQPDLVYRQYPVSTKRCPQSTLTDTTTWSWPSNLGPDCLESRATYDWRGLALTQTDPDGRITRNTYDTLGRPLSSTYPDQSQRTWQWHDHLGPTGHGKHSEEINELGLRTLRWYNGLGHPFKEALIAANGTDSIVTRSDYGIHGKLRWHRDGLGRIVRRGYDAQARLTREVRRGEGLLTFTRSWEWNDTERTLIETDANGINTEYTYNLYGQDEQVRRAMNNGPDYVAKYLFDNQGRTVLAVAPNGDTTETTYGVEGQPTEVRYPDRLTTLMDYNLLGEPTQRIRTGTGSGLAFGTHSDTLTWERDALGRETRTRVAGDPRMDRTTIWDKQGTRHYAGLPVRMELGTGLWTEYDYDSRLRLTQRRQGGTLLGHNMADTQTVTWRTDGQRSSLRTKGAQWNWTYDNLARLQKHTLTDPAGTNHTLLDSTTYAQDGLLTRTVLAHGAVLQQTWDAHRPLLTNWSASQNGTLLQEMQYKHDREGNITEMTRPQAGLASYAYDNLYRLTGVNYPSGNLSGRAGTLTYGYDLNGNRTQMEHSFGSESWDYHEGTNLMKQAQGSVLANKVYGKDWKGDRTRERTYPTQNGAVQQDASWYSSRVSAYNSRSELERHSVYRVGMDTTTAGFAYEERGKKILNVRAQVNGSDTTWNPELRYGWDGDWVLWDQDADGMRFYAYLGHRRIAELVPEGNSWKAYAVLTDHLGSVTGMVDSAGLAAEYLIDPYGNLEEYQGRVQTRYLYTGKEWLALLQGYDFGARIYDPVAGMWWGRDAKEQFWSVYARSGNPLAYLDPDGLEEVYIVRGYVYLSEASSEDNANYDIQWKYLANRAAEKLEKAGLTVKVIPYLDEQSYNAMVNDPDLKYIHVTAHNGGRGVVQGFRLVTFQPILNDRLEPFVIGPEGRGGWVGPADFSNLRPDFNIELAYIMSCRNAYVKWTSVLKGRVVTSPETILLGKEAIPSIPMFANEVLLLQTEGASNAP